jgi:hypothetical protein
LDCCNYIENDNKVNPVPRCLIAQENIFDRQDGHKHKEESNEKPCDHLKVNIGNEKEPMMVKIGKSTRVAGAGGVITCPRGIQTLSYHWNLGIATNK